MNGIGLRNVVLGMGGALALAGCQQRQETAAPSAPPVVLVASAVPSDSPIVSEAVAALFGSTITPVHASSSGFLIRQAYESGAFVKKGDLLFLVDPKAYHPELEKVHPDGTTVTAPEATNDFIKISAPVSGIVGTPSVGPGDAISPDATLATVATVDPIQGEFTIPGEKHTGDADGGGEPSDANALRLPISAELVLADGTVYPHKGDVHLLGNSAQASGEKFTANALFANPDRQLAPGQFVKVRVSTQRIDGAVLIPPRAVMVSQGVNRVLVVLADNTVELRPVTTGDAAVPLITITTGLKPGERVVVEGKDKCQAGMTVAPQPYVAPVEDPSPPGPASQ